MITIKKYAAIDVGSNAMRLLVANIIEEKGKDQRIKGKLAKFHIV